jgi:polyisoprenoid-binding protein YceI
VSTTNPIVDEELRGPEWLDAERFPTIVYQSDRVVLSDARRGEILGNLTLHGVTRAVALSVSFNGAASNPWTKKSMIGFDATARFRRSEFGVIAFVPLIGDEVALRISAEFSKV